MKTKKEIVEFLEKELVEAEEMLKKFNYTDDEKATQYLIMANQLTYILEEIEEQTQEDKNMEEAVAQHLKDEASTLRYEYDEKQNEEIELQEINAHRDEYIEDLNTASEAYRGVSRKSKRVLVFISFVCAAALYFAFSDWFGDTLGYIFTIAIVMIIAYCIDTLGVTVKNKTMTDGKLAYHACVAMKALIKIKNGTYSVYRYNIIGVKEGKHNELYKEFAQLYPELASKSLKSLSKITVTREDMYD